MDQLTSDELFGIGAADALGSLGLAISITSYLLLQLGLLRGDGYLYPALNLVSASAVLFSLLEMFNLYAALGEMAWIAISLVGLIRLYILDRFHRLSPEEATAMRALLPSLPADRARKLLALGDWLTCRSDEPIVKEGELVGALILIMGGRCRIEHDGVRIAAVGPGALIGEITFRRGSTATASVISETEVRLFRIETTKLMPLLARNRDIDEALELSIASDLRHKLEATTRELSSGRPPRT